VIFTPQASSPAICTPQVRPIPSTGAPGTTIRVEVLIIDDFALKRLRPPHDEDFHHLVGERYERGATIIMNNLGFAEWGDAFPANRIFGAATLDRICHGAYRIILKDDSFRTPRPLPEADKTSLANKAQKA